MKFLAVALVVGGLSGCDYANKADLDQLRVDHGALKATHARIVNQLSDWTQKTYSWESFTYQALSEGPRKS